MSINEYFTLNVYVFTATSTEILCAIAIELAFVGEYILYPAILLLSILW